MNEFEIFSNIPTYGDIIKKSEYNEGESIQILLEYLVNQLHLYAASALFEDRESNLYSPIFVYPEGKKIKKFVRLSYEEKSLQKFANRNMPLIIKDITNSEFYDVVDIDVSSKQQLHLITMPIRHFGDFIGILNCYFMTSHKRAGIAQW